MNHWLQYGLIVLAGAVGLALLIALFRSGHPLRNLFNSAVQGWCALGLVNLLGAFTGVSLGFSWLTVAISGGLGMPGATGLLLLKLIFPA